MGQARRRKQQALTDTPNISRDLALRYATTAEISSAGLTTDGPDDRSKILVGTINDGNHFFIRVLPVIDAAKQFNSHVYMYVPKGVRTTILQGWRKAKDHRAINAFLMKTTDVLITSTARPT